MLFLCVGLILINIIITLRYFFLRRSISASSMQIDEIEKHPERNRQLKMLTKDKKLEILLVQINHIYKARQTERIAYERRELQIRRDIENISHDLRTPLTSIIGYVDLIQDEQEILSIQKEYLQLIQKRARVLQGFIQDFYELSRMEGEHFTLQLDSLHVQNTTSEIVVSYYNEFNEKNIQVAIDLEDIPCYIIADRIQFHRILNNLIQNALKFAETLFFIKQFSRNGECIIQFKNDYKSIQLEDPNLMFERFYTGDESRSNQSTGLGLTIAKILVEKMNGSINASYDEGLFLIELKFPCK